MNFVGKSNVANGWAQVLVALMGTTCIPALADACPQWDVSGELGLEQSNGVTAVLHLQQSGKTFKGTASYGRGASGSGPVVGTMDGFVFRATVYWSNDSTGVYTGQVSPQGVIFGRTFDKFKTSNAAAWHSNRTIDCIATAPAPSSAKAPGLSTAPKPPPIALVRVGERGPPSKVPICDAAASARLRNSPAAPGLEAQCKASKQVTPVPAAGLDGTSKALAAGSKLGAAQHKVDAVSLNPQPLPPSALPTKAPSALQ